MYTLDHRGFRVNISNSLVKLEAEWDRGSYLTPATISIDENPPENMLFQCKANGSAVEITHRGFTYNTIVQTPIQHKLAHHMLPPATTLATNTVDSPISGAILSSVKEGDRVSKGSVLCVIEAMKMHNTIKSTFDGIVKKSFCKKGDIVKAKSTFFVIKPL